MSAADALDVATPVEWRMDAYYFGFEPTGVAAIDKILSAVACAGKSFHHTEDWREKVDHARAPHASGVSCQDWIQTAANDAAAMLSAAPPGYKLVPLEPTPQMLVELFRGYVTREAAYSAMLAVAPTPKVKP